MSRNRFNRLLRAFVVLALVVLGVPFVASGGGAQTADPEIMSAAEPIAGQYVVALRLTAKGDVPGFANSLARRYGGDVTFTYEHAFTGFAVSMTEAQATALARHPLVEYVAEDGVAQATATQVAPPWGLDRIDEEYLPLDGDYDYTTTGLGVRAYVIDTGIRATHSEFGGRATIGTDTVLDGQNGVDCNGHGTHVAGTVGGSTYGVAKQVSLVAVRVLNCNGSGSWAGVIAGVDWVTANHQANPGPAVANMSLGGGFYAPLNTAVTNSIASGVTYALAAGNSNADACASSPASTSAAITVGATTNTDARASYSNIGACLDMFAPGSGILSAWSTSDGAANTISGTSMAAPHVAGVAARYLAANPAASPATVASALVASAIPNVVTGPGAGSPNRLLFSGVADNITPVTTTTTTTTTSTTTTTTTAPALKPGAPQNVNATGQRKAVALTWSAPGSGGTPTGYRVFRGTNSTSLTLVATLGNVSSWTNTGLAKNRTYYFQVSALNSGGEGPRSTPVVSATAT